MEVKQTSRKGRGGERRKMKMRWKREKKDDWKRKEGTENEGR